MANSCVQELNDYINTATKVNRIPSFDGDDTLLRVTVSSNEYYLIKITKGNIGHVMVIRTSDSGIVYNIYENVDLSYYVKSLVGAETPAAEDGNLAGEETFTRLINLFGVKLKS